jgi:uncharacterized integral membrane protein
VTTPNPGSAGTPARDPLSVGLDAPTAEPAQTPTPTRGERARRTGRTVSRSLALGLLVFVTVVLVLFVVFNGQTVRIDLVFGDVDAPLVVALLIAAVLGALLGWLSSLLLRTRRRHRS